MKMKKQTMIFIALSLIFLVGASLVQAQSGILQLTPPYRVYGTVTADGTPLTDADNVTVSVTNADGTVYVSEDGTRSECIGLKEVVDNTTGTPITYYVYDILVPIKEADFNPNGALDNETAVIHVQLDGQALQVDVPANGEIVVVKGGVEQVNVEAQTSAFEACDANGDGFINVGDVVATINAILDPVGKPPAGNADCNSDTNINVGDVVSTINHILGA